ncbi:MAG: tRNA (N(6)-L-threonylcarbamoyladenosine(37)-C(2))-methylthiotransferase MtaB [Myxococcota bacterium]
MGHYVIHTLGCKANTYDGQLIERALTDRGWSPADNAATPDLIVVNSCTVTSEADRQSRKTAKRLSRRYPDAKVVMTGCGAEVDPERHAETEGVDLVIGNQDKPKLVEMVLAEVGESEPPTHDGKILGGATGYDKKRAKHPETRAWPTPEEAFFTPPVDVGRTRVFLKVQEGCDAFCTYCIIPYARGPARHLRPIDLVRQVREVCAQGAQEVVLTGTALGDYGDDSGEAFDFEDLVSLLLRETPLKRLRTSSMDPQELSPRLREMLANEPRLCPHVHVSLQSPHDVILKRMKRRYSADDVVTTLSDLGAISERIETERDLPGGLFVGMDVICGFPGETEAMHRWSLERLSSLPWHRLHVFPYSEREGTAATRLDSPVPPAERKRRVHELMDLSRERLRMHYTRVLAAGRPLEVLVEGEAPSVESLEPGEWCAGYTANYYRVFIPSAQVAHARGQHVTVQATGLREMRSSGELCLLATRLDH